MCQFWDVLWRIQNNRVSRPLLSYRSCSSFLCCCCCQMMDSLTLFIFWTSHSKPHHFLKLILLEFLFLLTVVENFQYFLFVTREKNQILSKIHFFLDTNTKEKNIEINDDKIILFSQHRMERQTEDSNTSSDVPNYPPLLKLFHYE
jgi:hypothetical protein